MTLTAPTTSNDVTTAGVASGTSITIAKPANLADSDLLIATLRSNITATATPPAGWTALSAASGVPEAGTHAVFYKYVTTASGEAANYAFSLSGSAGRIVGMIFRVTGTDPAHPVGVGGAYSPEGYGSTVLPGVTPVSAPGLLLALQYTNIATTGQGGVVTTPPSGMATIGRGAADNGTATSTVWAGAEPITTATATGTRTLTNAPSAQYSAGFMVPVYGVSATPIATPVVTLGATTNPTSGTNGSQVVTWPAVSGAVSYEAWLATNGTPAQSDFTRVATGVTSPYTFTGLSAGTYSFGIKAKAS